MKLATYDSYHRGHLITVKKGFGAELQRELRAYCALNSFYH